MVLFYECILYIDVKNKYIYNICQMALPLKRKKPNAFFFRRAFVKPGKKKNINVYIVSISIKILIKLAFNSTLSLLCFCCPVININIVVFKQIFRFESTELSDGFFSYFFLSVYLSICISGGTRVLEKNENRVGFRKFSQDSFIYLKTIFIEVSFLR